MGQPSQSITPQLLPLLMTLSDLTGSQTRGLWVIKMWGLALTAVTFSVAAAGSRQASGVICSCGQTKPAWNPCCVCLCECVLLFIFEYADLNKTSEALKFNNLTEIRRETDLLRLVKHLNTWIRHEYVIQQFPSQIWLNFSKITAVYSPAYVLCL